MAHLPVRNSPRPDAVVNAAVDDLQLVLLSSGTPFAADPAACSEQMCQIRWDQMGSDQIGWDQVGSDRMGSDSTRLTGINLQSERVRILCDRNTVRIESCWMDGDVDSTDLTGTAFNLRMTFNKA